MSRQAQPRFTLRLYTITLMKKKISIIMLAISIILLSSNTPNCIKEIKESDLGLIICLKQKDWYVNSMNLNKLIIGNRTLNTKIGVSQRNLVSKNDIKDIWNKEYGEMFKDTKQFKFVQDTTFSNNGLNIHLNITEGIKNHDEVGTMIFASAIIKVNGKYQLLDCMFPKSNERIMFVKEVCTTLKVLN